MATVGERVKLRRTELGWTQEVLAQKAGISKSFLSDLENGRRSIGAETLLDLGRAMGVSLDFLMIGEESATHHEEPQIPASLSAFAADAGLSVRDMMTLLRVQVQILDARRNAKRDNLEEVDWGAFYKAVKRFL